MDDRSPESPVNSTDPRIYWKRKWIRKNANVKTLPGCPSPTDSDVNRNISPSGLSGGSPPFPCPFANPLVCAYFFSSGMISGKLCCCSFFRCCSCFCGCAVTATLERLVSTEKNPSPYSSGPGFGCCCGRLSSRSAGKTKEEQR